MFGGSYIKDPLQITVDRLVLLLSTVEVNWRHIQIIYSRVCVDLDRGMNSGRYVCCYNSTHFFQVSTVISLLVLYLSNK